MVLVLVAAALFGIVRAYPWLMMSIRENRAMNMYGKAVTLVEQKKFEEGFLLLNDLVESYPTTKAARRQQNYIRSKEPSIKAYLADEARNIKKQLDEYLRIYGVLPANAIDINYIPSFWVKDFGEIYYRKDLMGKANVIMRGTRFPVDSYIFSLDVNNRESESDLTQQEFLVRSRGYVKLAYTGTRSNVRPVIVPRMTPKPSPVARPVSPAEDLKPEAEKTTSPTSSPIKKPALKLIPKSDDKIDEVVDEEPYEDAATYPDEEEGVDPNNEEQFIDEAEKLKTEETGEEAAVE
jgi:hypothetical protein